MILATRVIERNSSATWAMVLLRKSIAGSPKVAVSLRP